MLKELQSQRQAYIPAGAVKMTPKTGGAEFWLYDDKLGRPCCRCFIGKAQKPTWALFFKTPAQRMQRIEQQVKSLQARAEIKAKRRAEMNAPHRWEAGLIVCASWGYEQTNVNFYEVVEVIGSTMVKLEKIGAAFATDDHGASSMAGYVVPDRKIRTGEFVRCKVSNGAAKVSSYSRAHPWDGRRKYCSWYA